MSDCIVKSGAAMPSTSTSSTPPHIEKCEPKSVTTVPPADGPLTGKKPLTTGPGHVGTDFKHWRKLCSTKAMHAAWFLKVFP